MDLEQGMTQNTPVATATVPVNPEQETNPPHTDEQLLKRAREVNASGKFIFSCYSELNTFLLLKAQDEILRMQNKLHESVNGIGQWTEEESTALRKKLTEYHSSLALQKNILSWEHPPFKAAHSAGEFLFGKLDPSCLPLRRATYSFPSSIAYRPAPPDVKDFDGSDYVDLCPDNSSPINCIIRRISAQHFHYNAAEGRIVAHLQTNNKDNPIWRGSSASICIIARLSVSLVSVIFLLAPMFACTYIQPTGYILLAASLFSLSFAIVAAFCTRAANHEVFAVTAAYAAVIMVFVGNSLQGRYQIGNA